MYDLFVKYGSKALQKMFPHEYAKVPLEVDSRYVEYPFAIESLPHTPCEILDVGCSGSMFPLLLQAMGHHVTGLDRRPYPVPTLPFIQSSCTILPFENRCFDFVTAISTIEHVGISGRYGEEEDPLGDAVTMNEIHRVLKPEGMCILTVPFGDKFEIVRPYHRVYNRDHLNFIIEGFKVEEEEIAMGQIMMRLKKC